MKAAIATLTRQLFTEEQSLESAAKIASDPATAPPAREAAEALMPGLTATVDDLKLALAILEPVEKATGKERDRWKEGYMSLRNHCIVNDVDLG
jgi:hypothetical protein